MQVNLNISSFDFNAQGREIQVINNLHWLVGLLLSKHNMGEICVGWLCKMSNSKWSTHYTSFLLNNRWYIKLLIHCWWLCRSPNSLKWVFLKTYTSGCNGSGSLDLLVPFLYATPIFSRAKIDMVRTNTYYQKIHTESESCMLKCNL